MQALAQSGLVDRRYKVVRWIGQGACASVYEAIDLDNDRPIAIKVMNAELVQSPTIRKRFVQEAEAAVHIDSPFVVGVHAVGTLPDDRPYIVMELLEGEDLGRHLDRVGALEEQHAVELAIHALSGLAHAHKRGVIHRDIKPANLVLTKSDSGEEVLKIVDLGISKWLPSSLIRAGMPGQTDSELGATKTNAVLGSPVYMSPEQCRGAKGMDHRSDVYSVGVVLFECLTGHVPHNGENVNEIMFKIALEDAPDPRSMKPTIDSELAHIVLKALARDADKRFQSASAFREALLEWGAERGARVLPTPSSRRMLTQPTPSGSLKPALQVAPDDDSSSSSPIAAAPPASSTRSTGRADSTTQNEGIGIGRVSGEPSLTEALAVEQRRDRARRSRMLQRFVLVAALLVIVGGGGVLVKRKYFTARAAAAPAVAIAPPPPGPATAAPPPIATPSAAIATMPAPVSPTAATKAKRPPGSTFKVRKPTLGSKPASAKKPDGEEGAADDTQTATETDDGDPE